MSGTDRKGYILIGAMSDYEIAAIREHWLTHTDKEIGEMLGISGRQSATTAALKTRVKPTRGAKRQSRSRANRKRLASSAQRCNLSLAGAFDYGHRHRHRS